MSLLTHFIGHPFRLLASTLKIACFVHLTDSHLIQIAPAHGPSMLPTFPIEGISIVIDKTACRGRRVTVGDIVLYKIPLFPHQVGVKRIIGMPGDYVSLGTPGEAGEERMIQVPEGHCWIVGDNLSASRDSRLFGPLPLALVEGKVVATINPFGWIENGLLQDNKDKTSSGCATRL